MTWHHMTSQSGVMQQVSGGVSGPAAVVEVGPGDAVSGHHDRGPSTPLHTLLAAQQEGAAVGINALTHLRGVGE